MKRIIPIILLFAVFFGCGGASSSGEDEGIVQDPPAGNTAEEDTEEAPADEQAPEESPTDPGICDDGAMPSVYYLDADGDTYGSSTDTAESCSAPSGYVAESTDCDDSDEEVNPGAIEICDGIDNDCDGTADKGLSASEIGFDILFASAPMEIGSALAPSYEPSGVVWHPRLNRLFMVSDGGIVTSMDIDGSDVVNKSIGGDLEGITVAHPEGDFIYVGVEHPDSILEYDIISQSVTRRFYLDGYMTGPDNSGLEALAFVPDSLSDEGGYFYAGLQATGEIFVFELPIRSSSSSTAVNYMDKFSTAYGSDISDMYYDPIDDVLYAIYDSFDRLLSMQTDGTYIEEWVLPLNDQEGFSLDDSCHVYIGEDSGSFWSY